MTQEATIPAAKEAGVQSLHRALDVLESIVKSGGEAGVAEVAADTGLPLPTIHRILQTLLSRGYVRQLANRRYVIGLRFIGIGTMANSLVGVHVNSILADLVSQIGESANFAVASGDYAEYVAQVPSPHSMRMFTEVGRKVEMHCTGVGKALLSSMTDEEVRGIVRRVGLKAHTPNTATTWEVLRERLERARSAGYVTDDEEQEIGVRCVAMPVPLPRPATMAISVSGPVTRMTDELVERAVPLLRSAASRIAAEYQAH